MNEERGIATTICYFKVTSALPAGSTITVTPTNIAKRTAAVAVHLPGFGYAQNVDSNTGSSTSLSADSVNVSMTPALLFATFGMYAPTVGTVSFTPGTNGTATPCTNTGSTTYGVLPSVTVGSGPGTIHVVPTYCLVNASGEYTANATTDVSVHYAAPHVAFRP